MKLIDGDMVEAVYSGDSGEHLDSLPEGDWNEYIADQLNAQVSAKVKPLVDAARMAVNERKAIIKNEKGTLMTAVAVLEQALKEVGVK